MAQGKYKKWLSPEALTLIRAWARNGLTDAEIAKNMEISRSTLYDWKKKYPDISDSLKRGKDIYDYEVEETAHKLTQGYYVEEEKTYVQEIDGVITKRKEITKKYIKPETAMIIFWLKNRKSESWRNNDQEIKETSPTVIIEGAADLED